ncbi:MAG: flagellar basal body-associated FliL family protein [Oligoflexia bacterium]|nr:flagellar basal body-associated FliL family protein [Oligoflexia bacterium]
MSNAPAEADAGKTEKGRKAPSASKLPLLLGLANTLVLLAAMGTLVYTKLLYKRPSITEAEERARLAKVAASPLPSAEAGYVDFPATMLNIASNVPGRRRYANVGFSVEVRDKSRSDEVEAVRALVMDRLLSLIGRRQMSDLTNVQGRYLLRSELIDAINQILKENAGKLQPPAPPKPTSGGEGGEHAGGEGGEHGEAGKTAQSNQPHASIVGDLVSDVFFTQFTVQ